MAETIKSASRRQREGWYDRFAPAHLSGIDIGCQRDPLNHTFRRWDRIFGDGDCTYMAGVPNQSFHTVYASHVLEHLSHPDTALNNWWRILRPGGHLIVVVPHRDMYEKKLTLPSNWNGEHKTYWLPERDEPPCTKGLRQALVKLPGELVSLRTLDEGFQANGDKHSSGEYSIEAIVHKACT